MDSYTYDLFVSYSREDVPYVRELVRALQALEIRLWYDDAAQRFGGSFNRSIEEALERSRFFLVVLSPAYLSSDWGNFELGVALSRYAPEKRLVPVYARDVDPRRVPASVRNMNGLNARDSSVQELARLIADIVQKDKLAA
jgi:hypothetical protein